jgi:hypothetical protein
LPRVLPGGWARPCPIRSSPVPRGPPGPCHCPLCRHLGLNSPRSATFPTSQRATRLWHAPGTSRSPTSRQDRPWHPRCHPPGGLPVSPEPCPHDLTQVLSDRLWDAPARAPVMNCAVVGWRSAYRTCRSWSG